MQWPVFKRSNIELRVFRPSVGGTVVIAFNSGSTPGSEVGGKLSALGFKFNDAKVIWYRHSAGLNAKALIAAFPDDVHMAEVEPSKVFLNQLGVQKTQGASNDSTNTTPTRGSATGTAVGRSSDANRISNDPDGSTRVESANPDQRGLPPHVYGSEQDRSLLERNGSVAGPPDRGTANESGGNSYERPNDGINSGALATKAGSDGASAAGSTPPTQTGRDGLTPEAVVTPVVPEEIVVEASVGDAAEAIVALEEELIVAPVAIVGPVVESTEVNDIPFLLDNYIAQGDAEQKVLTKVGRFDANINVLTELERYPVDKQVTKSEAEALLQYSGWGGLLDLMASGARQETLQTLMPIQSLQEAQESALTAFYTPDDVVIELWDCLLKKGYTGGRVMEPSAGTGIFLNHRPHTLDDRQHFTAVEMDTVAARILSLTNPKATVLGSELQNAGLGDSKFDLVIGNVPFGEIKIADPDTHKSLSIHNYFLKKSLRQCRDNGIVAIVTSTWTMDSKATGFREDIASMADLMGVIRMPGNVFSATQTNTMSDLLIFKKRPFDAEPQGIPFIDLKTLEVPVIKDPIIIHKGDQELEQVWTYEAPVAINEAFLEGGLFAGEVAAQLSRFGDRCELMLLGDLADVKQSLQHYANDKTLNWFDNQNLFIEQGPYNPAASDHATIVSEKPYVGSFVLDGQNNIAIVTAFQNTILDGQPAYGISTTEANIPKVHTNRVHGLIHLRQQALTLLKNESQDESKDQLDNQRRSLNLMYDEFVGKFGFINNKINRKWVIKDSLGPVLLGLEIYDADKEIALKSDIFAHQVIKQATEVETAKDLISAAAISFSKHGDINKKTIENLLDCPIEDAINKEPGVLLLDPETKGYQIRDIVLSGNVRKRLRKAQELSLKDKSFQSTVEALEKVIPTDIPYGDIGIGLASTWVPLNYIEDFIKHQYRIQSIDSVGVFVKRGATNQITIKIDMPSSTPSALAERVNHDLLGTKDRKFISIVQSAMLNKPIRVTTKIDGVTVEMKEATLDANNKLDMIKEAFNSWVWQHAERRDDLVEVYNNQFNAFHAEPTSITEYNFNGLAMHWTPRPHQTSFVVRSLMHGNSLAAHCVGAGKTMEMVMLQMEKKRLGIANKPAIAVPNNMLYQIAQEASSMYPNARIALINSKDLEKSNRTALLARIAMNDWDLVVLTHGVLSRIPVPVDFQMDFQAIELDWLRSALDSTDEPASMRQIQIALKSLRTKIAKLQGRADAKAEYLSWDMINIDAVAVDEAHLFKNLELDTTTSLPGISSSASDRAWDLYMKSKYLNSMHGGKEKGLDFFTGTPISNTIAELYTMNRFLRPSLLKDMGINNFNDWVGAFGEVVTELEMLPEGGGYHLKSRLTKFKNVPELITAFRMFADIKTREDLQLPVPHYTEIAAVAPQTKWQSLYMDDLTIRATAVRGGSVDPRTDNILKIINDGRRSAMDMRLVESTLPFEADTKLDLAVENLLTVYNETHDVLGAQLVFCDLSAPKKEGIYDVYNDVKERLLAGGIPLEEIAFIHDAKNDIEKFALFNRVKSGAVRFLIGSTAKMGIGTNVQDRLAAIHEVDAPWKPADIEQRLGRIVRQGNSFKSVKIFRYTTEDSFDLFIWETNKRKAQFIAQIMRDPKQADRNYNEDTEINFAEVVAITTGNPIIKEKVDVDAKVAKLARRQATFYAEVENKKTAITRTERTLANGQREEGYLKEDMQYVKEQLENVNSTADFAMLVKGRVVGLQDADTTWIDRQGAAKALQQSIESKAAIMDDKDDIVVGAFMGVEITLYHNSWMSQNWINFDLKSDVSVRTALSGHVTLARITDVFEYQLINNLSNVKRTNADAIAYLEVLKGSNESTVFSGDAELSELQARQKTINAEMAIVLDNQAPKSSVSEYKRHLEEFALGNTTVGFDTLKNLYEVEGASAQEEEASVELTQSLG